MNHADWVLNSQKSLILKVNANISTQIISDGPNKKLFISNISEEDIDNLYFLTNTDQNNNYLYIERFDIYVGSSPTPLPIPSLENTVKNVYYNSDINSFINGQKVHYPFNALLYQQDCLFRGNTFSEYIDFVSDTTPLSPSTRGLTKIYNIVLNPDSISLVFNHITDYQNPDSDPNPLGS